MGASRVAITNRPRVSIVIPVCNEQGSLQTLKIRLNELQNGLRGKFIVFYLFIDDGSTDRTLELIPMIVPDGGSYRIVSHGENRGIGAAFRTGFEVSANADVICTIDADCSYRPQYLVQMIQDVISRKADVVVASPYHPLGTVEGVPKWRLQLSRKCSQLYRVFSPLKLYTYTSMFRAYRGSFIRRAQFRSDGFVSTVEILLSASHLGYCIAEMPATLTRRVAGTSKMRIARTVRDHLVLLSNCLIARNKGYPDFCTTELSLPLSQKNRPSGTGQLMHVHR